MIDGGIDIAFSFLNSLFASREDISGRGFFWVTKDLNFIFLQLVIAFGCYGFHSVGVEFGDVWGDGLRLQSQWGVAFIVVCWFGLVGFPSFGQDVLALKHSRRIHRLRESSRDYLSGKIHFFEAKEMQRNLGGKSR